MRAYLSFLFICALAFFVQPGVARALSVDDVRFGAHPGKTRMVLDLDRVSDFRVFMLESPYRMVIDLPSFTWKAGTPGANKAAGISAVRYGNLQAGVSRIVFDLTGPASVQSAFVLPKQMGKKDRLVIDFALGDRAAFLKNKGRVHGTLEVGARVNQPPPAVQQNPPAIAAVPTPPRPKSKIRKSVIVLDPGHGGVDPGAIGSNKVFEKNIVLSLAKELKKQLEATGRYRVLMTRERDVYIKLYDRVKFARRHNADLFVSIHADSIKKSHIHGASIYTLSETASDKQTERLAARENRADLIAGIDLSVEDEEVADILVELAMRETMNQSKFFANTLVKTFDSGGVGILENPHRYAGFAVLKAPDVPSVLIEAGFMSNRKEARLLSSHSHRKKIATAIKRGIDAYFARVKRNDNM